MKHPGLLTLSAVVIVLLTGIGAELHADSESLRSTETDLSPEDPFPDEFGDEFFDPFLNSSDDALIDPFSDSVWEDSDTALFDPFAADSTEPAGIAGAGNSLSDFDAIFFTDSGIREVEGALESGTTFEQFLVSTAPVWSGRFSGLLDFSWNWESYLSGIDFEEARGTLAPSASASLLLDARPEIDYRVFGKFFIETGSGGLGLLEGLDLAGFDPGSIQFSDNGDGSFTFTTGDTDSEDEQQSDPAPLSLTLGVRELFADFDYREKLFFRFGKSFITWGVGYFFSPADLVNLDSIDAENPAAERQGPLNLRLQYPTGVNSLSLLLIADQVEKPEDLSLAGKYEWVQGGSELGFGGLYRYGRSPKAVATLSSSVRNVRIFGEALLSLGSDRVFAAVSPLQPEFSANSAPEDRYTALETFTVDSLPFLSATVGFSYSRSDPNLFLAGQYFFNGEGYPSNPTVGDDRTLLDAVYYQLLNPDSNPQSVPDDQRPDDYVAPPQLRFSDLRNFGMHYGALAVSWNGIGGSDLSGSLFWIGNLTDGSGIISPSLRWELFSRLSLSGSMRLTYGASGTEFADPASLFAQNPTDSPQEPTLSVSLTVSAGGGSF